MKKSKFSKLTQRAIGLCVLAAASAAMADSAASYVDGLEAIGARDYAEAEKVLTAAVDADGSAANYQARGVARVLSEKLADGIADLEKSAKLAGGAKDWETSAWIAIANKMNNNLNVQFIPGMAPRAEMQYALALNDLGQNYWQSRYKGSYFDKAQRKQVQTTAPYLGDFAAVGKFYVAKHRGALKAADPAAAKALLSRIDEKIGAGKNVEALAAIRPLLAATPGDPDLLAMHGKILTALGDLENARAVYTDLLTRKPSPAAYIARADVARKMGDDRRAYADLTTAGEVAAKGPSAIDAYLRIRDASLQKLNDQIKTGAAQADIEKTAGEFVFAALAIRTRYDERYQIRLAELEAALAAKPNDPEAMIKLGRFLHDESSVVTERVGPRGEEKMYRVQSAEDKKRELARSNELVETALKNFPDNLSALTLKAHLKSLAGEYDEAETIVRKALAIKKDDPDLLEVLASLLQVQAARHLTSAGNLKQPKMWFETHFDEYPPAEYIYRRFPSPAELAQAAELEKKAAQLAKLAEECIGKAAEGAGPTAEGWYYRATLQRVRGDSKGARESMTKAVTIKPDYEQAWFQLAGICTELRDGDAAVAARAKGFALSQTTAQAQLNALWYKIPRGDFKTARETIAEGVAIDPADPRLPAYLAVIDEAADKTDDALARYRFAAAINEARLAMSGTKFGAAEKNRRPITPEEAALPAACRLRIAAILLDQGKPAEAGKMFAEADAVLRALAAENGKPQLEGAMLPNPATPAGVVPIADSVATLQIRAAAGALYSQWAAQINKPEATALAAKTYRRMFITYIATGESIESMRAIADLGTAQLYVYSKNFPEAAAAMKSTPAVPQEFWKEMRETEAAVRNARPR